MSAARRIWFCAGAIGRLVSLAFHWPQKHWLGALAIILCAAHLLVLAISGEA